MFRKVERLNRYRIRANIGIVIHTKNIALCDSTSESYIYIMPTRVRKGKAKRRIRTNLDEDATIGGDTERFDLGPMNIVCKHCGALKWKAENKALCCANGQVQLPPIPDQPHTVSC